LSAPPIQDERGIIIPASILRRASLAAEFALACRMEEGEIIQIGDNDSGRLFKFLPSLDLSTGLEKINDHRHLLACAHGLGVGWNLPEYDWPDRAIVSAVAHRKLSFVRPVLGTESACRWRAFADFGLFFNSHNEDCLAVRCGHNGQYDNGGHAHNDQLSIVYARRKLLFLVDPGTFLYTPTPELRNRFRSTRHHNTVYTPDMEQNDFSSISLFNLSNQAKPEVMTMDECVFRARHHGFGLPHTRTITFGKHVEITDEFLLAPAFAALHLHPAVKLNDMNIHACILKRNEIALQINFDSMSAEPWRVEEFFYSPGYGMKVKSLRLVSPLFKNKIQWEIV